MATPNDFHLENVAGQRAHLSRGSFKTTPTWHQRNTNKDVDRCRTQHVAPGKTRNTLKQKGATQYQAVGTTCTSPAKLVHVSQVSRRQELQSPHGGGGLG